MVKYNKHRGSDFDDDLKADGMYEEVQTAAVKRVVVELIEEGMQRENLSKVELAKRMGTSRSQLERVLDPGNLTVQLDTLLKAARAVGQEISIGFKPMRVARSS